MLRAGPHLLRGRPSRVIHAAHGWWFPEQEGEFPNLFGVWKSNINKLIPMYKVGKLGYGAPYKGVLCKISKVTNPDAAMQDPTEYVPREDRGPNSFPDAGEKSPYLYENVHPGE